MKDKTRTRKTTIDAQSLRVVTLLTRCAAGLVAAHIVVIYALDSTGWRLWGLDFGSFLKERYGMVLALLLLLPLPLLFPSLQKRFSVHRQRTQQSKTQRSRAMFVGALIVIVGAAMLAIWSLDVAFPFLGDGAIYSSDIFRVRRFPDYHSALIKPTSALTGYVLVWLARTFPMERAQTPYQIVGCAAALVLIASLVLFRRKNTAATTWLAAILFGGSAGAMMFFGYVELYALQYAFCAGFFLASWTTLDGRDGIALPTVMLILAIASGLSSVIFVPAWVFLVAASKGWIREGRLTLMALTLAGLMVVALPLLYLVTGTAGSAWLMPLMAIEKVSGNVSFGPMHYTMFSFAHIVDILNAMALHATVPVLMLIAIVLARRSHIDWRAPQTLFALLAIAAGGIALLTGMSSFGLARDWDLAAMFVMPLVFVAFLLAARHLDMEAIGRLAPLLLALQVSLFGRWILVNHDDEASARRFASIMEANLGTTLPSDSYNGFENLRKYYWQRRDPDGEIRALKAMWSTRHLPLITIEHFMGPITNHPDPQRRATEINWLVGELIRRSTETVPPRRYDYIDPGVLQDQITITLFYAQKAKMIPLVEQQIERLRDAVPAWRGAGLLRAARDTTESPQDALRMAESGLRPGCTSAPLLAIMGKKYKDAGRYDDATIAYRRALAIDKYGYPKSYLMLARVYDSNLNKRDSAIVWLRACVRLCKNSADAGTAEAALRYMKVPVDE
jgi:tetratricopeptide (TPR) repeat protein